MKMVFLYIKLYLMFLFRIMLLTIGVEIAFYIILIFNSVLNFIANCKPPIFPASENINLIAFAVATMLAMQTTYIINGRKGKVWSDTFGFDPEKFKKEEKEKDENI